MDPNETENTPVMILVPKTNVYLKVKTTQPLII